MPLSVPLFAAALSAVAATAPTAAPGPVAWSSPVSVGPPGLELSAAVSGRTGAVLAAGYGPRGVTLQAMASPGAGAGRLLQGGDIADVGVYGDRAVFLRHTRDGRRVGVSFGDLGLRDTGRSRVLHRGRPASAQLAVGAGGQVLVALGVVGGRSGLEFAGERVRLAWSVVDGPRRRWRSVPLPGRTEVLAVEVDPRGTAVVLVQRPSGSRFRVAARTLTLGSGRLSPERPLGRTAVDDLDGAIATNGKGDAVVAWGAQDGGEEADRPYVVRAAVRRRGTTRFGVAQTLDPGDAAERPGGWPVAAIDDEGTATVGWTQALDLGVWVPRAATAPAGRPFGRRRSLMTTGTVGDAVAHGTTTLLSVAGSSAPDRKDEEPSTPTQAGVVARTGAAGADVFEPVSTASPADAAPALLTASPTGFAAVWAGGAGGRDALRYAARPLG